MLSAPGAPRSTTAPRMKFPSAAGVGARPAPATRVAAPAAAGAAALVPLKQVLKEKLATHDAALTSGLMRLSFVGPCELYGAICVPRAGSVAPTHTMPGLFESHAGTAAANGFVEKVIGAPLFWNSRTSFALEPAFTSLNATKTIGEFPTCEHVVPWSAKFSSGGAVPPEPPCLSVAA